MVALRKESVDRNFNAFGVRYRHIRSLSARRAWIEILIIKLIREGGRVALRKESVDRNPLSLGYSYIRRQVALRKESVDRNPRIQAD